MQFKDILHNLPEVSSPTEKRLSFNIKLKWTLIVLAGSLIGQWVGYTWAREYLFWTVSLGVVLASLYSLKKFACICIEFIGSNSTMFPIYILTSSPFFTFIG